MVPKTNLPSLTKDELEQFNRDGFIVLRDVLPTPTIRLLMSAMDSIMADGGSFNRDRENGSDGYRNCISLHPDFIRLLDHPRTLMAALQILGPHIHLMGTHAIHYRGGQAAPPKDPRWHTDIYGIPQDIGYEVVPRLAVKCAFCLSDHSQPNSGMTVLARGSNRLQRPFDVNHPEDARTVIVPALNAGDVFLFENRLWHAIGWNVQNHDRRCIMINYGFRWLKPLDYLTLDRQILTKMNPVQLDLIAGLDLDPQGYVASGRDGQVLNELFGSLRHSGAASLSPHGGMLQ
ncbi:MAG: phytanoyl-CoA dioxygenase family protein [Candidatus Thiodiazotropha sp. (ex Dulcina madagascariensis)]|nr:phytanoyl-CoA dioxygenase family protein [Candidatus Thiodiazotropha sp. (ex Dulcina madagascariensis)]